MTRGRRSSDVQGENLRAAVRVALDPVALDSMPFSRRASIKRLADRQYAASWLPVGRASSDLLVGMLTEVAEEFPGSSVGELASALANGRSQRSAAERIGISPQHVSRHVKRKLLAILLMKLRRLDADVTP